MSDAFHSDCPARMVLDHVTSRWGVLVLTALRERDLRFYELRAKIEGISEKMLSQTLRTLVRDGLVGRTVEPSAPPKVTYELTSHGHEITEPLMVLSAWISQHAEDIVAMQAAFDQNHSAATHNSRLPG
jgi:DNA-binding HxlR family transcriptional regulator